MTKVSLKILDRELDILQQDGIPGDLINTIREKVKDEDLE
ncbi:hypothetical protein LCGC14_1563020, partial [marine sediment metagenome]